MLEAPEPVQLFRFSALSDASHGISTRLGGTSTEPYRSLNLGYATGDLEDNVASNRGTLFERLRVPPERVVTGRLSHGNCIATFTNGRKWPWPVATAPVRRGSERSHLVFASDAVVSNVPGLFFLITCADCVPLAFWDRRSGAVGAAHAGWRGTALQVAPATVCAMQRAFGSRPEDIVVGVGPSIGPCCYRVQDDVRRAFAVHGSRPVLECRSGRVHLDLWKTNEQQLLDSGIPKSSIEVPAICTSCNTHLFYSHRAERGATGRFALCIGLR